MAGSTPQSTPARTDKSLRATAPVAVARTEASPVAAPIEVPRAAPSRPEPPGAGPRSTIAPDGEAPRQAAASTPPPHDAAAADRWTALVHRMVEGASVAAMVRELAMQAECWSIAEGDADPVWRLRVERENLRTPALRERLQAAMAEALRQPVRPEIEAGVAVDTPAERAAEARRRRQAEAEQAIHDEPLVKALLAQYKTARIVPGSVKPL
jgi:DNA polymerase-3 subunit gamma/tau